jgi:biopolymer transport protein ExbD
MSRSSAHHEIDNILARARRGTPRAVCPARRSFYERARRQRGGWMMSLNLTPMIDTVFNLLFFFMIVSRFGAIEGLLPGKLPVKNAAAAAIAGPVVPRMPIRIRLNPDPAQPEICRYSIDRLIDAPGPLRELPARLEKIRTQEAGFGPETEVYLFATDEVAWDHVVNAYNASLSAGYDRIYFAAP